MTSYAVMSPTSESPSGSPSGSLSSSPTDHSCLASAKRLSDAAIEKLRSLTCFNEHTVACGMTPDPLLNQALTDINPNIFRKNKSISDTDLRSILKHCPSLTTLDLSGFHQISEEALLCIATLQQLTTLNLSETKVVDLGPLCRNPLSKLQTLNLLKTDIPPASLFDFLQRHTITNLLPPANPPKGFFGRFQSDSLQEIMLHIDRCDPESLPFHEITRFVKNARSLKKLWVRINAKTEFNVSEVSGPLCTRDFIIESQNLQALFKLPAGNVS